MQDEKIDKEDMRGVLRDFPGQVIDGFGLPGKLKAEGTIDRIIVTGMGGSALPGEILHSYLDSKIPVFVNKDYELPAFAGKTTLVFAISYSGNTEETIQAYRDAQRKGCAIVVITSGGKLDILARKNNHPLILVPRGLQPRMGYGYLFFAILRVLQNSGLAEKHGDAVEKLSQSLKSDVFMKKGEELASHLIGKTPLIYTSQSMHAVGYKWKINFNENTKIHAFCNVLPEMNHNEILGYTNLLGDFHAIFLREENDRQRIKLRMDITKDIIRKKKVEVTEIGIAGSDRLQKIFFGIYIGDWVSYFLAMKYKRDPTPVAIIEDLKKRLAE